MTTIDLCNHNHEAGSIRARLCARRKPFTLTAAQFEACQKIWADEQDAYLYYDGSVDNARTINRTHALVSIATKGFPVVVPSRGLINLLA